MSLLTFLNKITKNTQRYTLGGVCVCTHQTNFFKDLDIQEQWEQRTDSINRELQREWERNKKKYAKEKSVIPSVLCNLLL